MPRTIFQTERKENRKSRLKRYHLNFFPAFRRMGGRICFISADWKEVHVKLRLKRGTKNYVGTVFGGSIYGTLDPVYMVQLIHLLGPEYVVWDKSAEIKFLKPIQKTVYARFLLTDEQLEELISIVSKRKKHSLNLAASFSDERGTVYAEVRKTLFVVNRDYYETLFNRPKKTEHV